MAYDESIDVDPDYWMRRCQIVESILIMDGNSLIGDSRDRFKNLSRKNYDWKSFYNGWLEGRVDLINRYQNIIKDL